MKYKDLPETPVRPHTYFALESIEVSVKHPDRKASINIHCKISGNGPPLLLIHGLMTSGYSFRYVIPELAKKYRVIVPDLPGAGRSQAPLDLSMSPKSIATFLDALVSALQIERPCVVGNSLGGYQALWFATLFPTQLRKLIVIHAPGFFQLQSFALRILLASPIGRALFRKLISQDPESFVVRNIHYYDSTIMSRQEAREYSSIFRDPARTDVFIRILRESFDPRYMRELVERLSIMKHNGLLLVPIRLFWAKQDVLVPAAFGHRYQKLLPSAELVWFDHAGHFLQVDDPARTVREIMRFDE
ncbi:MAG TPA: alpha/beta hydrolase [Anaerolineales bacterium]|nr:alpha/beta hydrolase [Anaerolineales bacterium]